VCAAAYPLPLTNSRVVVVVGLVGLASFFLPNSN